MVSLHSEARILVIDSWPTLRGELAAHLGVIGYHVVVADPGAGVARVVEVFRPDLVIIEVIDDRPEEIVNTIRANGSALVIVTVASTVPPDRRARAMRAGADDVLVKPFEVDELLARIQMMTDRHRVESTLTFGDLVVDELGHTVRRGGTEIELTVTEFNLLAMFLRNAGRVLSKRQLLATVWGFDDYDVNLVEVHVSALRKKLEQSGPRIVQTVRGIGYVLREASPAVEGSRAIQLAFTA
jgi:two-component system, OmpR family, response regulator